MTKKKKGTFSKVTQVKKMSREAIGVVPSTKVVPQGVDRATKGIVKHPKRALEKELES